MQDLYTNVHVHVHMSNLHILPLHMQLPQATPKCRDNIIIELHVPCIFIAFVTFKDLACPAELPRYMGEPGYMYIVYMYMVHVSISH